MEVYTGFCRVCIYFDGDIDSDGCVLKNKCEWDLLNDRPSGLIVSEMLQRPEPIEEKLFAHQTSYIMQ